MFKELFFALQGYLDVEPQNLDFDLPGGTQTVNVYCSGDWSVTDKSSWITVIPSSGTGGKSVHINVGSYVSDRLGSVTFSSGNLSLTLNVLQAGGGFSQI